MGTMIKAFGLDRNADAADRGAGGGALKKKKKKKKKWVGERVGGKGRETGPSAERPVQLMPCTGAQNYLRFNDPIHSSEPASTPSDKPHKKPS